MTTPLEAQLEYMKDEKTTEVKVLQLSTKSSAGTLLNGSAKSYIQFNLRDYIDFEGDDTIDYITVSCPYAIIPNSTYNVADKNNKLVMDFSGNTYTYTFANGNYTYQTFMTAFKALVPAAFSITYNSITAKFTITNSLVPFTMNAASTMDYVVGFSGTTASTTASAPYTLVMPRCVCFLPEPIYNICCMEINNGSALAQNGNFAFSSILASVPNNGKINSEIVYNQDSGAEFPIINSTFNYLTIQIMSDEGLLLDFNGLASFFTLRFKIHKKVRKILGGFSDFVGRATRMNALMEADE